MSKMILFHGSQEKLTLRNIDKEYGVGTADGVGFYTSTEMTRASMYGEVITKFEFEAKKAISSSSVQLPEKLIKELISVTNYQENYGEAGYGGVTEQDLINEAYQELVDYNEDDVEVISSIINAQDATTEVLDTLIKNGFNYSVGANFKTDIIVYQLDALVEVRLNEGVSDTIFDFTSDEFTSVSVMNKEKKRLMNELADFVGADRNSFRLQQGNVTLQGLTDEGNWLNLTSRITDFPTRIKAKSYKSFRLRTKLAVNKSSVN